MIWLTLLCVCYFYWDWTTTLVWFADCEIWKVSQKSLKSQETRKDEERCTEEDLHTLVRVQIYFCLKETQYHARGNTKNFWSYLEIFILSQLNLFLGTFLYCNSKFFVHLLCRIESVIFPHSGLSQDKPHTGNGLMVLSCCSDTCCYIWMRSETLHPHSSERFGSWEV